MSRYSWFWGPKPGKRKNNPPAYTARQYQDKKERLKGGGIKVQSLKKYLSRPLKITTY